MTDQQFRNFVERYTKRFKQLRQKLNGDGKKKYKEGTVKMVGPDGLRKAKRARLSDVTETQVLPDEQDRELRETRSRKVPPKYLKQLDAYFRAVSEGQSKELPTTRPSSEAKK